MIIIVLIRVMQRFHVKNHPLCSSECSQVIMRPTQRVSIDMTDEAANLQSVAVRQANKTITISSSETLEITITRTGMQVK